MTFLLDSVHFQTIKSLKSRSDIHITKPDKGSGVVILNSQDYIGKMEVILPSSYTKHDYHSQENQSWPADQQAEKWW